MVGLGILGAPQVLGYPHAMMMSGKSNMVLHTVADKQSQLIILIIFKAPAFNHVSSECDEVQ